MSNSEFKKKWTALIHRWGEVLLLSMERNNFEKENEFLFNYSQKETIKKENGQLLSTDGGKCFSYSWKETILKKKMESGFPIDRKKNY